ncbi:uncharacterized protein LOC135180050 [Pogoniulus pusillus]|uniref:uncharacterized protein LOC135180050 n=1 Tax=Pogoniulus pusillus TaxID=488313 RepID=UPI0030B93A41
MQKMHLPVNLSRERAGLGEPRSHPATGFRPGLSASPRDSYGGDGAIFRRRPWAAPVPPQAPPFPPVLLLACTQPLSPAPSPDGWGLLSTALGPSAPSSPRGSASSSRPSRPPPAGRRGSSPPFPDDSPLAPTPHLLRHLRWQDRRPPSVPPARGTWPAGTAWLGKAPAPRRAALRDWPPSVRPPALLWRGWGNGVWRRRGPAPGPLSLPPAGGRGGRRRRSGLCNRAPSHRAPAMASGDLGAPEEGRGPRERGVPERRLGDANPQQGVVVLKGTEPPPPGSSLCGSALFPLCWAESSLRHSISGKRPWTHASTVNKMQTMQCFKSASPSAVLHAIFIFPLSNLK